MSDPKPFEHPRWTDPPFDPVPPDEERKIVERAVEDGLLPREFLDRFDDQSEAAEQSR